jgi:hypothetical protein
MIALEIELARIGQSPSVRLECSRRRAARNAGQ